MFAHFLRGEMRFGDGWINKKGCGCCRESLPSSNSPPLLESASRTRRRSCATPKPRTLTKSSSGSCKNPTPGASSCSSTRTTPGQPFLIKNLTLPRFLLKARRNDVLFINEYILSILAIANLSFPILLAWL